MPRSERRRFIKKKQLRVVTPVHERQPLPFMVEDAAYPFFRTPMRRCQCSLFSVEAAAAISHQRPAFRNGMNKAKGINAVL